LVLRSDVTPKGTVMVLEVEKRLDVWIGVSLEAPHMRYPGHRHPSEEICVVGRAIVQASDPWHSSGIGGWVPMLRT
jgi:hypothetical protein